LRTEKIGKQHNRKNPIPTILFKDPNISCRLPQLKTACISRMRAKHDSIVLMNEFSTALRLQLLTELFIRCPNPFNFSPEPPNQMNRGLRVILTVSMTPIFQVYFFAVWLLIIEPGPAPGKSSF
jgi:hypothetical protein